MHCIIWLLLATFSSLHGVVAASLSDDSSENLLAVDTDDYYATDADVYDLSASHSRNVDTAVIRKRRPTMFGVLIKIGSSAASGIVSWCNSNKAEIETVISTTKKWNGIVYAGLTIAIAAGVVTAGAAAPVLAAVAAVKIAVALAETGMMVATSNDRVAVKGLKVMLTAVSLGVDLGDASDALTMVGIDGNQAKDGVDFLKEMGETCTQASSAIGVAEAVGDLDENSTMKDYAQIGTKMAQTAGLVVDLTVCDSKEDKATDLCKFLQGEGKDEKKKLDNEPGKDDPELGNEVYFVPCGGLLAHLTSAKSMSEQY